MQCHSLPCSRDSAWSCTAGGLPLQRSQGKDQQPDWPSRPVFSASGVLKYLVQLRAGSGVANQTQEVTAEELTWLSSVFCAHTTTTTFKIPTESKPCKSRLPFEQVRKVYYKEPLVFFCHTCSIHRYHFWEAISFLHSSCNEPRDALTLCNLFHPSGAATRLCIDLKVCRTHHFEFALVTLYLVLHLQSFPHETGCTG